MDQQSPEVIERDMAQTRESLTEKVALLEQSVAGKIERATDAVNDTVQSVRSAVQDTVSAVSGGVTDSVESLKAGVAETLDVSKHVRENPWAMMAGAAVAGFITGMVVFPGRRASSLPAYTAAPGGYPVPVAAPRPAWLTELLDLAGREAKKLVERTIAQTSSAVQENVEQGIPKLIERALPDVGRPNNGATPRR